MVVKHGFLIVCYFGILTNPWNLFMHHIKWNIIVAQKKTVADFLFWSCIWKLIYFQLYLLFMGTWFKPIFPGLHSIRHHLCHQAVLQWTVLYTGCSGGSGGGLLNPRQWCVWGTSYWFYIYTIIKSDIDWGRDLSFTWCKIIIM